MKLFDYLNDDLDYSNCKSIIDVASMAHDAFDDLGIETEEVLENLGAELGIKDIGDLFAEFEDLDDAGIFLRALGDVFEYEDKAAKYPWDVADVVVGMLLLYGKPDLREQLSELPYRER